MGFEPGLKILEKVNTIFQKIYTSKDAIIRYLIRFHNVIIIIIYKRQKSSSGIIWNFFPTSCPTIDPNAAQFPPPESLKRKGWKRGEVSRPSFNQFRFSAERKGIYETTWLNGCADGANPEIRNVRRFTKSNRFLWTVAGYLERNPRSRLELLFISLHSLLSSPSNSSINLIKRFFDSLS